jgi:hypothetical protein
MAGVNVITSWPFVPELSVTGLRQPVYKNHMVLPVTLDCPLVCHALPMTTDNHRSLLLTFFAGFWHGHFGATDSL